MFGELVGLWAASVWQPMGAPENVRLVELGPGRGTMMLDALRAAQVVPAFRAALVVHLVEISPALRAAPAADAQAASTCRCCGTTASTRCRTARRSCSPTNSSTRCRCTRRSSRSTAGTSAWSGSTSNGNLAFGIADEPMPLFDQLLPPSVRDAPLGSMFEWRTDNLALELGRRIMRQGGAALIVDYGHVESATGETLQAVGRHGFADPLGTPGQVDLTAHVDFQALRLAAESMGARVHGPLDQAEFLRRMGIERRAAALKAAVTPDKAERHRRRGRALDRRRPHRHGQTVQGDRVHRSQDRRACPDLSADMTYARPASARARRAARHPPRLLHPRRRRVGRRLCHLNGGVGSKDSAAPTSPRTARAWRRRSASGRSVC